MAALGEAWRKPPHRFHRWIATHPVLYVALVVGVVLLLLSPSISEWDAIVVVVGLATLIVAALAAGVGAALTRRRVEQFDSRTRH